MDHGVLGLNNKGSDVSDCKYKSKTKCIKSNIGMDVQILIGQVRNFLWDMHLCAIYLWSFNLRLSLLK